MKYTLEKVLYFAGRPSQLHVSHEEAKQKTHLHQQVDCLLRNKFIKLEMADEDTGLFYSLTPAGEVMLLEMQIVWRTVHRKDISEHEVRLAELRKAHPNL